MNLAQLESEIMSLPVHQTALVQRLLLSLEEVSETEFDRLWGEESARRMAEVDADRVQLIPGVEIAKKARDLLSCDY